MSDKHFVFQHKRTKQFWKSSDLAVDNVEEAMVFGEDGAQRNIARGDIGPEWFKIEVEYDFAWKIKQQ